MFEPKDDRRAVRPVRKDRCLITVLSGPDPGAIFGLKDGEITLGRDDSVSGQLHDPGLSRRHARITRTGEDVFMIEDFGSTNGTFVNGEKVEAPRQLADGDRIAVGPNTELKFSIHDALEQETILRLRDAAVRDPLTGVVNRRYLMERLRTELSFARRHGTSVSVLMFDLDYFKRINDTYGHPAGDHVLKEVSKAMLPSIRAEDVLGRYGGEEFMIIARGISTSGAIIFAQRVRVCVENLKVEWNGQAIPVTTSVGVTTLETATENDPTALILLADSALYDAKQAGRNRVASR